MFPLDGHNSRIGYNSPEMSRPTLAILIFLASLTALAQPGLCPCWLLLHVEDYHPHPAGQTGQHSHDYLHELYQSQTAAWARPSLVPAAVFVLLLAGLARRHRPAHAEPTRYTRALPVDRPPPRLASAAACPPA